MTSNQIALWSYQENARHNRVTESEAYRHNTQTENLGWNQFWEQQRVNSFNQSMEKAKLAYNYDRLNADISIENAKMANQYAIAQLNAASAANVATINAQVSRANAQLSANVSRANAQLSARTQERTAWINNQGKIQSTKINAASNAAVKAADRINASHIKQSEINSKILMKKWDNEFQSKKMKYDRWTYGWMSFGKYVSLLGGGVAKAAGSKIF